jgi:sec-independent protein translocase protein TatB
MPSHGSLDTSDDYSGPVQGPTHPRATAFTFQGSFTVFFDIGPLKLVALMVLAVVIFGPDKLPKLVSEAMGFIRKVRAFSDAAKEDIRKELGPEFKDFEFEDLNPKTFVRKQLATHGEEFGLSELQELKNGFTKDANSAVAAVKAAQRDPLNLAGDTAGETAGAKVDIAKGAPAPAPAPLAVGEAAPYDLDAT